MVKRRSKSPVWESAAAKRLVKLAGDNCSVEQAIVKVVRELLSGVHHPPTDLDAIQTKLRVAAVRAEDLPFSGELRPGVDGFMIVHSKYLSPGRRRFTIAHELGHALLATTGKNYPRWGKEVERLCDMLAAEILMPEDAFVRALPPEIDLSAILELASTFKTSWWAAAIRCANFKKFSVFEADSRKVHWSSGVIRRGPVSALDSELQHIVKRATEGAIGRETIYLTTGSMVRRWAVDFSSVGDRARVLLRPVA
jgi:hypothetical protein